MQEKTEIYNGVEYRLKRSIWKHYPIAGAELYVAQFYDGGNMVAQGGSDLGFEAATSSARRNLQERFKNKPFGGGTVNKTTNKQTFVMVALKNSGNSNEIMEFVVVRLEDMKYDNVTEKQVIDYIGRGHEFVNLSVENGKVRVSSGAEKKYPVISNDSDMRRNGLPTILCRIEKNNKLVGYYVFLNGRILKISVDDSIKAYKEYSNGKIVDGIVVSKRHEFPVKELVSNSNKEKKKELDAEIVRVEMRLNNKGKVVAVLVGLWITEDNAVTMSETLEKLSAETERVHKYMEAVTDQEVADMYTTEWRGNVCFAYLNIGAIKDVKKACRLSIAAKESVIVSVNSYVDGAEEELWCKARKDRDLIIDEAEESRVFGNNAGVWKKVRGQLLTNWIGSMKANEA